MLTTRASAHPTHRLVGGALLIVFVLAACGAAGTPTAAPDPTAGSASTPRPTPTPVPGDPGSGSGGGGTGIGGGGGGSIGGGTDPGAGGGGVIPLPPGPDDNPLFGSATYLTPSKDLIDLRTVNVQLVRAVRADDGVVTADLRWWSGVAPCSQLDHVELVRDDAARTIRLTVIEGSGQGDMACIEIAELHATAVDLGVLPAGTWSISAAGDAPPIKLDVP